MAKSEFQMKINLKLLVDPETNKVVFAEAGKDFVDFLFQLMSLPLSTVTKLLTDELVGMAGCLGALYKSIESLNAEYYEPNPKANHSVLKPKAFFTVPLLSLDVAPTPLSFYRCQRHPYTYTPHEGDKCNKCMSKMEEVCLDFVARTTPLNLGDVGYVKGPVPYIVMDNLEVKPMSVSLIMSIVKNYESLMEKEVEVGPQQGLALLKASMEKQAALTSVFLRL